MAEIIKIFGKEVPIKDNLCTDNPSKVVSSKMRINLYISITDVCLAKCPFCNNNTKQNCSETKNQFDVEKLSLIMKELKGKDLLNRVSVTGGEPLLNVELLNKVLNAIFEICGDKQMVTINTNGVNLKRVFELESLNKLEGIHISRHHFDDEINDKIFGFRTAHKEDIKFVINKAENKKLFRLNCLLIKNYIANKENVTKFLEFASDLGIFRVGFVGLMPINEYSINNYVEYKEIFEKMNEQCFDSERKYNKDICDCWNSIYCSKNGKLVEFYGRTVRNLNCDCVGQFNYSADNHLKAGFDRIII